MSLAEELAEKHGLGRSALASYRVLFDVIDAINEALELAAQEAEKELQESLTVHDQRITYQRALERCAARIRKLKG